QKVFHARMEHQQLERLGYPPLPPLRALASILFRQEIPPRVCLAPSAPGGARGPFIVCLAEERSFHISYFSAGGPLSVSGHSPRVVFLVVVGCSDLQKPLLLLLDLLVPSSL